jgi:hypothetical protein
LHHLYLSARFAVIKAAAASTAASVIANADISPLVGERCEDAAFGTD